LTPSFSEKHWSESRPPPPPPLSPLRPFPRRASLCLPAFRRPDRGGALLVFFQVGLAFRRGCTLTDETPLRFSPLFLIVSLDFSASLPSPSPFHKRKLPFLSVTLRALPFEALAFLFVIDALPLPTCFPCFFFTNKRASPF